MSQSFDQQKASSIVNDLMLANDRFSQWLGIEVTELIRDKVSTRIQVRNEMTNGFGIAHGGIVYSLCDSAFAFASNQYGRQAVSIETNISHLRPIKINDVITATAEVIEISRSLGRYKVTAVNQDDKMVAVFNGTVFYIGEWEIT